MLRTIQQHALKLRGLSTATSAQSEEITVHAESKLANLLVKENYISADKLAYASRVRSRLATSKTLLQVLQELQLVTSEQLCHTLCTHRLSVGDLLVELGHIRDIDLKAALSIQQTTQAHKKLGEILVEGHFIEEQQLVEVLAYQLGLPYVDLQGAVIDQALLAQAPLQWYADHSCLPVSREEGRIVMAFADPLGEREAAIQVFGAHITVAVATKKAIHEVIARLTHQSPAAPATSVPAEPRPAVARPDDRVTSFVSTLLSDALREQVSDIHIEPLSDRLRIRFRRDGVLSLYKEQRKELAIPLTNHLKGLARLTPVEPRRHQEGRIRCEDRQHSLAVDVQASFSVTIHGEKIVLRLQGRKHQLPALETLGMLPHMLARFRSEALDTAAGVVLITGPAGAGKTVTLYSCLSYLSNTAASIITVEEPAEYVLDGMAQCTITPQSGLTWDETLHHVVRQDADVIALSELRNRVTAEAALQAALSGRKVLTTVHGGESLDGVLRLLHLGIDRGLIASTLRCVVAQQLLRRICPVCVEPYSPTADEMQRLGYSRQEAEGLQGKMGRGCEQCRATGYRGRIGIYELLCIDEQVQDALLAGHAASEIRRLSLANSGLGTLLEDGILKAIKGFTSFQEVLRCLPRLRKPRPGRELQRLVDAA